MVGQRQHGRLTGIRLRFDIQQLGDAHGEGFGAGQRGPFGHAVADLSGGHVFGGHDPRSAPIALHGIGVGEVLAHLGGVLSGAQGVAEDLDALIGAT